MPKERKKKVKKWKRDEKRMSRIKFIKTAESTINGVMVSHLVCVCVWVCQELNSPFIVSVENFTLWKWN